jgi:hypothetical protein
MQIADAGSRKITNENGGKPYGDNSTVGGLVGNTRGRRHKQLKRFENNSIPLYCQHAGCHQIG